MPEPTPSKRRILLRRVLKVVLALLLFPPLYLAAAWVLGAWSVNGDSQPSVAGTQIFLRSNGVHTDILLPREPWLDWFPDEHFQSPLEQAEFVAIGWGHKGVYLEIPSWSDLTLGLTLNAALGLGESVCHVTLTKTPKVGNQCRSTRLTPEQYERLDSFVRRSFQLDEEGRPIQLAGAHYHGSDAFYQAHGQYNLLNTCNVWTGDALRDAGLPTGLWTPLAGSVLSHYPL